jgi:predicted Zn-dependent protease
MIKKIFTQGAITILLFFGMWYLFAQADWVKILNVRKVTDSTEQKLGDLLWNELKKTEEEIHNIQVINTLDSIIDKICKSNDIDPANIKVHVLQKDEINAFVLPNGHLVVYSGLILNAERPEEIAGVISHEIAHITRNHVMKKLISQIGLSVLVTMTNNSGNLETIQEATRLLSSSAFDRTLEKEADIQAVDYLINANVNPEPLAEFLYKLSIEDQDNSKYLTWISTHPDSKERAEYILSYSKNKFSGYKPIISEQAWNQMKAALKD